MDRVCYEGLVMNIPSVSASGDLKSHCRILEVVGWVRFLVGTGATKGLGTANIVSKLCDSLLLDSCHTVIQICNRHCVISKVSFFYRVSLCTV